MAYSDPDLTAVERINSESRPPVEERRLDDSVPKVFSPVILDLPV
jgi:hypothetical protein